MTYADEYLGRALEHVQKCNEDKPVNGIPSHLFLITEYTPAIQICFLKTCTNLFPLKKTTCYHEQNDDIHMDGTIAGLFRTRIGRFL